MLRSREGNFFEKPRQKGKIRLDVLLGLLVLAGIAAKTAFEKPDQLSTESNISEVQLEPNDQLSPEKQLEERLQTFNITESFFIADLLIKIENQLKDEQKLTKNLEEYFQRKGLNPQLLEKTKSQILALEYNVTTDNNQLKISVYSEDLGEILRINFVDGNLVMENFTSEVPIQASYKYTDNEFGKILTAHIVDTLIANEA